MSDAGYDNWDDSVDEDRKSSRGGTGKKWGLLWRPGESPTKIHLSLPAKPYIHPVSGKGLPFRASKRHFIPGKGRSKKGLFLECGVDRGEPCVVDAYINPAAYNLANVAPDPKYGQFPSKVYYAVSGWIEEEHHLVDCKNNHDDGTHKERHQCQGRGCENCAQGYPIVFGKPFYMEVSPGQWRYSIHDLHKQIENSACQCGGTLYVPNFCCAKCGAMVLDVSTTCDCGSTEVGLDVENHQAVCGKCHKSWSALYKDHQKIYEASNEAYKCTCGHNGFLKANRICSTEGCEGKPLGVFDAQLTIKMTGSKKERRLIIENYVIQEPDPRLFDPQYQGDEAEWAEKVAESHRNPIDLDRLLRAPSVEEQCKELSKPNPFNAVGRGAAQYAKYGEAAAPAEGEDTGEASA